MTPLWDSLFTQNEASAAWQIFLCQSPQHKFKTKYKSESPRSSVTLPLRATPGPLSFYACVQVTWFCCVCVLQIHHGTGHSFKNSHHL